MKSISLILILVFSTTTLVNASEYETRRLFEKGAWFVDLTYSNETNSFWCAAQAKNGSGQTFSVTAYDSRLLSIFVFDRDWELANRPVRFLIDIDYERWTVDGTANGIGVSISMQEPSTAIEFLWDLQNGNAVAVLNKQEARLATFSLNGSFAAISNLMDCWATISQNDEATSSSDPFGSVQDPF